MIVLKSDEMRKVDENAIADGFSDLLMMENAGRGAAELLGSELHHQEKILVFAGKGNNGGDGLVIARHLNNWGYPVHIIIIGSENQLSGSTKANHDICRVKGIKITYIEKKNDNKSIDIIKNCLLDADVVVDAMLGTGVSGEVRKPYSTIIKLINESDKMVFAVDIPSGVDGDNGKILGKAVAADFTATMAYPKLGMMVYPGREYCGHVNVIDLGVPESYAEKVKPTHFLLTEDEAAGLVPLRPENAHKGTFGKVGVIGGSNNMPGAPAMTGTAVMKSGAGLVRVAVPAEIQATVAAAAPEMITIGFDGTENTLKVNDFKKIDILMRQCDVLAVGPGLGQSESVGRIVQRLLDEYQGTIVLDADGINVVKEVEILKNREQPLILTPHPGELSRLIEKDIEEIQNNRIQIAREFAVENEVILVLKGADTVIALPDSTIYLNTTGNAGMATAGSGDVLTGITAGFLAQGLPAETAAVLAAYIHGLAGDLGEEALGSYSLMAGDIITYLPAAFRQLIGGSGEEHSHD